MVRLPEGIAPSFFRRERTEYGKAKTKKTTIGIPRPRYPNAAITHLYCNKFFIGKAMRKNVETQLILPKKGKRAFAAKELEDFPSHQISV